MQWDNTEHTIELTKGIEVSVYSSLKYLGAEFPIGNHKLKPSFATANVIDACTKRYECREKEFQELGPKLSVDIHSANKAEISLYALSESQDLIQIDRWNLGDLSEHMRTLEDFLSHIAENCHKIVKVHSKLFNTLGQVTVNCGLIFRQPVNQLSLTDSMLTDWNLKQVECENGNKDLARLFHDALKLHESQYRATINCTHVVNDCVSVLAGMHILYKDRQPDIMVSMSQSQNICFFYCQHKIPGFEAKPMIVNSEISHFGELVGSCDHELLCKFLTPIEHALKTISRHDQYLLPKLTDGYHIAETLRTFINLNWPELQNTFTWLKVKSTISESDISNFLEFVETNNSKPSKLTSAYLKLEQHKQKELSGLCTVLVLRSASLMAAIAFGFVRVFSYVNRPTQKVTVGLDGSLMKDMFKYRQQFVDTIKELQQTTAESNDFEPIIVEISFVDSALGDSDAFNILLAEHVDDLAGYY